MPCHPHCSGGLCSPCHSTELTTWPARGPGEITHIPLSPSAVLTQNSLRFSPSLWNKVSTKELKVTVCHHSVIYSRAQWAGVNAKFLNSIEHSAVMRARGKIRNGSKYWPEPWTSMLASFTSQTALKWQEKYENKNKFSTIKRKEKKSCYLQYGWI